MPIENEHELEAAVIEAGRLLQNISDYTGRTRNANAKVRFPRGVIRTAEHYRQRLPDYLTHQKRSSCAYGSMYLDVLWWVANRTDLDGVAKEMMIKSAIITLGMVLEALLHIPGHGIFDSNAGVNLRLDRAYENGWLNNDDCEILKRLWEHRCRVHLRMLDETEFNFYRVEHFNGPNAALKRLKDNLIAWSEQAEDQ